MLGNTIGGTIAAGLEQQASQPAAQTGTNNQINLGTPSLAAISPDLQTQIDAIAHIGDNIDPTLGGRYDPVTQSLVQPTSQTPPTTSANGPSSDVTDTSDFEPPVVGAGAKTYTVSQGETVASIAWHDPAEIAAIVQANHLGFLPDGSPLISPGQNLVIPALTTISADNYSQLASSGNDIVSTNAIGLSKFYEAAGASSFDASMSADGYRKLLLDQNGAGSITASNAVETSDQRFVITNGKFTQSQTADGQYMVQGGEPNSILYYKMQLDHDTGAWDVTMMTPQGEGGSFNSSSFAQSLNINVPIGPDDSGDSLSVQYIPKPTPSTTVQFWPGLMSVVNPDKTDLFWNTATALGNGPDYINFSFHGGLLPTLGGPIQIGGSFSLTRDGTLYGGVSPQIGTPPGDVTFTANWLNQNFTQGVRPTVGQIDNFNTAHSFSAGGGWLIGGQETWSPGSGTATGIGFVTPGAGASYTYSTPLLKTGLKWGPQY